MIDTIQTKRCSKCGRVLPIENFGNSSQTKDGLYGWCKDCVKKQTKQYNQTHKEKIAKRKKEYRQQHKQEISEYGKQYFKQYYLEHKSKISEYNKQYYKAHKKEICEHVKQYRNNNKEKISEHRKHYYQQNKEKHNKYNKYYLRKKRKTDIKYNLSVRIGVGIRQSLRHNKAGRHWESLVGYTVNDLKKRLEKTMPDGYTWQDFLNGKLHIDHIIPRSVFNYTKPEHYDFKRCWALDNLQLLPAEENFKKRDKHKPFQPALAL